MRIAEYRALTEGAGLLDLSDRGRVCVLGADREKFLHGQVTNEIVKLRPGQGTVAALVNAKGRIEADLYIFKLPEELLLDFEPGLTEKVQERLRRYIIAEDIQIVDVSTAYGLLSLQGPGSEAVLRRGGYDVPTASYDWVQIKEMYIMRNDRFNHTGFDLFVPGEEVAELRVRLEASGAVPVSGETAEMVRVEEGIPRFGKDMDESNLAPETGLERRAISYAKGCYIGQEVIARIRTYGQVAKALRRLLLSGEGELPKAGAKLLSEGKEVGTVTSFTWSPKLKARAGLGYVRKEANAVGTRLTIAGTNETIEVSGVPFED